MHVPPASVFHRCEYAGMMISELYFKTCADDAGNGKAVCVGVSDAHAGFGGDIDDIPICCASGVNVHCQADELGDEMRIQLLN